MNSTASERRGGGFAALILLLLYLCIGVPGRAQALSPGEKVTLSVRIESPDPARSIGPVIEALAANGLLLTEQVTVAPGELVSNILKERFQLPGVGMALMQAVAKLNLKIPDLNNVKAGDTLVLPQSPKVYESRQIFWKGDSHDVRQHEQRSRDWGAVRLPGTAGSGDDPFYQETFRGYEYRLVTDDVAAARKAAEDLWDLSSKFGGLRVALIPVDRRVAVPRYSSVDPGRYWRDCNDDGGVNNGLEGTYSALLPHLQQWDIGKELLACRRGAQVPKPTVILIDTLVYPHAEFGGVHYEQRDGREVVLAEGLHHEAIDGAQVSVEQILRSLDADREDLAASPLVPVPGASAAMSCNVGDFTEERDHGTHLASIIASRADTRGFSGLAPDVTLRSIDDDYDYLQLTDFLRREAEAELSASLPRVFVFAKPFPHQAPEEVEVRNYATKHLDSNGQLKDANSRFRHDAASVVDTLSRDIWVVAAGQDEKSGPGGPKPIELTDRTPLAPQNLGDLPNVIVATTCATCGSEATLWPKANTAGEPGMITVAAPGLDIPGAIAGNAYAKPEGGTSESTAFVGGVVAAMLSCGYERYKRFPEQIKRRLRLAGRPIEVERQIGNHLTPEVSDVVVVDPRASLLDPSEDWLLRRDSDNPGVHQPTKVVGWCGEQLRVKLNNAPDNLETSTIRRLVRLRPDEDAWAVFHIAGGANSPERESIQVKGPYKLTDDKDKELLQVQRVGGAFSGLARSSVDDIILSGRKGVVSCQAVVAGGPPG